MATADHHIEQFVLGTIMANAKAAVFVDMLTVDDFDKPHHQMVFHAIAGLVAKGQHASPHFLAPQFTGDLLGEGGMTLAEYVKLLAKQKAVAIELLPDYLRELKLHTARRLMAMLGPQIAEISADPGMDVTAFLGEVQDQIGKALAGIQQNRATEFTFAQVLDGIMANLRERREPRLVKTGLRDLDRKLGGLPRGELVILAGRPGMGKTTLVSSIMRQSAEQFGTVGHLFSLEMGRDAVSSRMLSDAAWNSQTPIPYENIDRGEVSEEQIERLFGIKAERIDPLPIVIDDQPAITIADMRARLERRQEKLLRQGSRLDLVVADHAGYIRASDRYRGMRVQELGEISKGFKAILRDLDAGGVLLSQLNRQTEQRENNRPMMSDLRESGNLEEDADTVAFAFRAYYYFQNAGKAKTDELEQRRQTAMEKTKHVMEIIFGKRRGGPVFTHVCSAFMGSNAIRDLADNRLQITEQDNYFGEEGAA